MKCHVSDALHERIYRGRSDRDGRVSLSHGVKTFDCGVQEGIRESRNGKGPRGDLKVRRSLFS
jgi:hypothetical protein